MKIRFVASGALDETSLLPTSISVGWYTDTGASDAEFTISPASRNPCMFEIQVTLKDVETGDVRVSLTDDAPTRILDLSGQALKAYDGWFSVGPR